MELDCECLSAREQAIPTALLRQFQSWRAAAAASNPDEAWDRGISNCLHVFAMQDDRRSTGVNKARFWSGDQEGGVQRCIADQTVDVFEIAGTGCQYARVRLAAGALSGGGGGQQHHMVMEIGDWVETIT